MNSLNLRQVDGGNVIKQSDFGSNLSFELLDERRNKIPELDGQTATIRLIKGDNIAYQTESLIVDGAVSFKLDRVLEKGIYVLEIVAGNYVFPSDNMVKITIEKTAGNYKPENMIKTDLVELQGKITAIEQREHDINQELLDVGQKQAEMTKRIETLEQKEDHDTIYNDTEIKQSIANVDNKMSGLSEKVTELEERPIVDTVLTKRVEALEQKEDKDTVYDDSAIVKRIESLEAREDKDTVYDDTNLKAQVSELQEKLKSLNTVRRAPTGYTLDRTTTPWTVWFDNGCGLQFPSQDKSSVYGYGVGINLNDTEWRDFPLQFQILKVSMGMVTIEKMKAINGWGQLAWWRDDHRVINPINDKDIYDWSNVVFATNYQEYKGNQKNIARILYELGIWDSKTVESFGAIKK